MLSYGFPSQTEMSDGQMNRVSEGGEKSKETKVKKVSQSLLMKEQPILPQHRCSASLQVLLVRKQSWRIKGRLWEGRKCVEKAMQRLKNSPESVIKDKERKRVDEVGLLSLMYPWVNSTVCVFWSRVHSRPWGISRLSIVCHGN